VSAGRAGQVRRVRRPAVLQRIPLDRSVIIEASAGSGKTFTLEHLVVELLLTTEVTLDRILVVTFTEKATNELRMRLRAKLEELRSTEDPAASVPAEIAAEGAGGDGGDDDAWVIDDAAQKRLDHALRSFDGATITTIHAFCQRVLRENAFSSGRLFREQQVDGRDAFARAMPEALRRDVARDPGRAPWLEAALGSGWSIDRIQSLLWDCVQSRGELRPVLDAGEITRALDAFSLDDARRTDGVAEMRSWGMHASTAKTVARRLYDLADVVERARTSRSVPRYALDAQAVDFAYLLEKIPPAPPGSGPAASLCAAAVELARLTPTFAGGLAQTLLPAVRDELARRKREAGQYDFDDMLALVDEALRGPRAAALASAMRERWRYVLIDEFQDTDETQWSIFRRGFFEGKDRPGVLCLVGDPKQSIYRFRGADVDTYLRAREEVLEAGGQQALLDHNYRATPELVLATNLIFDQTAAAPMFTGSLRYTPLACGKPDRTLADGAGRAVSPVHVMRFSTWPDAQTLSALGTWMASEIRAITDPSRPWRLDGRALGHGDVFVLTRTSREGRVLGAALRAAGVPHTFYKQDGLFQTDEARDLRTLLAAVDDPGHRARRLAAWLTPFFGLPLAAIDRARDLPGTHPLVAGLHAWKAIADSRDFGRLFDAIVRDSGLVRREIFFADGERELTNYLHLFELLLEHAHRTRSTLGDLVQALSGLIDRTRLPLDLEGSVQRLEGEEPAVQIMTVHKSKGLEAPIVFVAGGFPQSRGDEVRVYHDGGRRLAWAGAVSDPAVEARARAEEREEEQRLMYVALTRAQGRMYLPCAVSELRPGDGEAVRREPRNLRGPYGVVNRRIASVLESRDPHVTFEDVPTGRRPTAEAPDPQGEDWRPPAALLREATRLQEEDDRRVATLRRSRLGPLVTSYTRMRGDRPLPRSSRADVPAEPLEEGPAAQLRGARTSGVFLHELLERVPLASFAAGDTIDAWRSRPDVSALLDEAMAVHRIDRPQRDHAERLVWAAYTTPVALPGGGRIAGIASAAAAAPVVREMDFAFAVPGSAHATDPAGRAGPLHAMVRGSIDLAFEHAGATYFVDWKSDSLPSYAPETLGRHVHDHYETQARLYAVAIVKLLGEKTRAHHEARFGGMLYCFLRGLDARGHGVWAARPSWEDVQQWERELRPSVDRLAETSP
jgi:exodeoxyribonuclease V beta subunit